MMESIAAVVGRVLSRCIEADRARRRRAMEARFPNGVLHPSTVWDTLSDADRAADARAVSPLAGRSPGDSA